MSNPTLCDRWFVPGKSQWSGGPPQLGGCLDRRRRRKLATFAVNQIWSFLPTTLSAGRYQEAEEKFLQAWELQKKASKAMAEWWLFDDTCYICIICASCLVAAAQVNYATMFGLATVLTEQGAFGENWIHSKSCLECSCDGPTNYTEFLCSYSWISARIKEHLFDCTFNTQYHEDEMSSTFSLENLQVKVASCYKQRHNLFPPWRCAMIYTRICGSGIVIVINEMFGNRESSHQSRSCFCTASRQAKLTINHPTSYSLIPLH